MESVFPSLMMRSLLPGAQGVMSVEGSQIPFPRKGLFFPSPE